MTNDSKKQKFFLCFDSLLGFPSLAIGRRFSLSGLYLYDCVFQGYFGYVSCMIMMEELVSLTMAVMETRKNISQLSKQLLPRGKMLQQKHESYR